MDPAQNIRDLETLGPASGVSPDVPSDAASGARESAPRSTAHVLSNLVFPTAFGSDTVMLTVPPTDHEDDDAHVLLRDQVTVPQSSQVRRGDPLGMEGDLDGNRAGERGDFTQHGTHHEDAAMVLNKRLTLVDLFGELFEADGANVVDVVDPVLIDTRSMLREFFGPYVREEELDLDDEKQLVLAREMAANKAAATVEEMEELFGEHGAAVLTTKKPEGFSYLSASVPAPVALSACDETWLADMPIIEPNRQTLHADPSMFHPKKCVPLVSTPRMLYTTQNVIRWSYHMPTNTFMSNARVVRWSDGSTSLHVGSDVFDLKDSKDSTLHLLSRPTTVRKGKLEIPAMTSAFDPDRHFVVESTSASSVEKAVIEENTVYRSVSTEHKLAYSTAPVPRFDLKKPPGQRTPIEEYVIKEYEKRQKEIERRNKEGRPMTLTEQMELESELLNRLQTLNAEDLLQYQQEQERELAMRVERRAAEGERRAARRSRLDRHLTFTNDQPMDAEGNYGSDNEDEGETFEEMMMAEQRKRDREMEEEDNQRRQRISRREEQQAARYQRLATAIEEVLASAPPSSSAAGSLQGTLEFLRTGSFSDGTIRREVPMMMEEVREDLPNLDLTRVAEAFGALCAETSS